MTRRLTLGILALGLLGLSVGPGHSSASQAAAGTSECNPPAPPPMPPATDFVSDIDNTYFPLEPGTTFLYRGIEDGESVRESVTVTDMTKEILEVHARVVLDFVVLDGVPAEKTFDWYAQDKRGNVWYLGENAFDYIRGQWVRSDGSWEAGRDGAQPGIIMEAYPQVGEAYAQEHYPGYAEDMAQVLRTDAFVEVPYGTFHNALKTLECTPLEPRVLDHKFYARGVGEVRELTVKGGSADLQLVTILDD